MDIVKAFTFLTEDERWLQKLGIGTAVVLISVVLSPILIGLAGFMILIGYCVRLLENVRDGVARPLPEWDRWGEDMVDGFKLTVAFLLYALPIIIFLIPAILGAVLADQRNSANFIGVPLMICGMCLTLLYAIFLSVAEPGIMIAFTRDHTVGSALRFGEVWEWTRRNIGPVIIVALVYMAASSVIPFAAVIIGTILLVVGLIVTIPLGTLVLALVQAHLYGQLAAADPMDGRRSTALAPLAPVAPLAPIVPVAPPAAPTVSDVSGESSVTVPPVTTVPPVAAVPPVDPFAAAPSEWTPAPLPSAADDVVTIEPALPAPPAPVASDWPAPDAPPSDAPPADAPGPHEGSGWNI